ncbi:unnamed protein product [Polarella glacialis]|uniref:OTU domain-containing protein n=1 Tax=Polarella glacialis TaxID=89957 RepID=A0A813HAI8_POLGL|nr:unnamed protein product [Polarella glacialis]
MSDPRMTLLLASVCNSNKAFHVTDCSMEIKGHVVLHTEYHLVASDFDSSSFQRCLALRRQELAAHAVKGGRGRDTARARVQALRDEGLGSPDIRRRLGGDFSKSRLSQLLKESRTEGVAGKSDALRQKGSIKDAAEYFDAEADCSDGGRSQSDAGLDVNSNGNLRGFIASDSGDESDIPPSLCSSSSDPDHEQARGRRRSACLKKPAAACQEASSKKHVRPSGSDSDDLQILFVKQIGELPDVIGEVGQAFCLSHARLAQASLCEKTIPGDGNCFYRATADQTNGGEDSHLRLRAATVREVRANRTFYAGFLTGGSVQDWCRRMAKPGQWSDDLAACAAANVLGRPLIVWRVGTDQLPTCFVHRGFDETVPVRAIHLLLDESRPRQEHFSSLHPDTVLLPGARIGRRLTQAIEPRFRAPRQKKVRLSDGSAVPVAASRSELRRRIIGQQALIVQEGSASQRPASSGVRCVGTPEQRAEFTRRYLAGEGQAKICRGLKIGTKKYRAIQQGLALELRAEQRAEFTRRYLAGEGETVICRVLKIGTKKYRAIQQGLVLEKRKRVASTQQEEIRSIFSNGEREMSISKAMKIPRRSISELNIRNRIPKNGMEAAGVRDPAMQRQVKSHTRAVRKRPAAAIAESDVQCTVPGERDGLASFAGHEADDETDEQEWVAWGSWTFCPDCGRRRPDGKWCKAWRKQEAASVAVRCKGGCDRAPQQLCVDRVVDSPSVQDEAPKPEQLTAKGRLNAYVIPRQDRAREHVDYLGTGAKEAEGSNERYGPRGEFNLSEMYGPGNFGDWPLEILQLTDQEVQCLSVVTLRVQQSDVRGGMAPTSNKKKTGVVTAYWRRSEVGFGLSVKALAAFEWLMRYNETYRRFVERHRALLAVPALDRADDWFVIKTAELLLRMPGVEVAARPWLYPVPEYGDSDLKSRLVRLGQISARQKPSLKASWVRKLLSRCVSYEADFELFSLLFDIALARQVTSIVSVADLQGIAPKEVASNQQNFDSYWEREQEQGSLPNLFFTIAPAEWKFLCHKGLQHWRKVTKSLSQGQAIMTLHMNHVIGTILKEIILKKGSPYEEPEGQKQKDQEQQESQDERQEEQGAVGSRPFREPKIFNSKAMQERFMAGIEEVLEFSFRWEFQGRGTIHVHVLAWVRYRDFKHLDPGRLAGRSNQTDKEKSELLQYLEQKFNSSVDVQCGNGNACLLRYVTGYVSKASDALTFKQKVYRQEDTTQWRQAYRLLCKRAPLVPEMAMEFAGLPLMEASFRGATIYAPIPGKGLGGASRAGLPAKRKREGGDQFKNAKSASRALYEEYLKYQQTMGAFAKREAVAQQPDKPQQRQAFISWARLNTVVKSSEDGHELVYQAKARGGHGAGKNKEKCALGVHFPYELLDNFIGAWCAMMAPHVSEAELMPKEDDDTPAGARYLKVALDHPHYGGDVEELLKEIVPDLILRGLSRNRIRTFKARIRALKLLLDNTGSKGMQIPASLWDARRIKQLPARSWSPEQKAMLEVVREGVAVDDANLNAHTRMLLVTGKPGVGKTEAVIGCAMEAAMKGERVLIACPIGALVDTYRQKLPPHENIVIETAHASHRITRKADEQYIPPGRLRSFDLIIYDEVSQLQDEVWRQVRTAIVELNPHPFICFVGDFKQLQPAFGEPELKDTLEAMVRDGTLRHIELQRHALARSNDPLLLEFLSAIRERQPERSTLGVFFGARRLAQDLNCRKGAHIANAVAQSKLLEEASGEAFTFLTVTNDAALKINHTRCDMEFGSHDQVLRSELYKVPGDPNMGGGFLVVIPGMRIRFTRNVDKERGFVNGALAEVEYVLRKDVFVAKTPTGVRILVHPVMYDGEHFMPFCYGYAMTIRRSQGSTMEMVGLWFDHKYPADRGYAYVGSSRVRRADDLYLMGKIRRTDWLPVGGELLGNEETERGFDSATTSSDTDFGSEDQGSESGSQSDEDQGAASSHSESEDEDQADSSEHDQSLEVE